MLSSVLLGSQILVSNDIQHRFLPLNFQFRQNLTAMWRITKFSLFMVNIKFLNIFRTVPRRLNRFRGVFSSLALKHFDESTWKSISNCVLSDHQEETQKVSIFCFLVWNKRKIRFFGIVVKITTEDWELLISYVLVCCWLTSDACLKADKYDFQVPFARVR